MPVSMPFPLPFSMYGAIEDALRLSWAVRKKPLESFLLPAAAFSLPGGAGVLVCRDGSLVSLFRLDGYSFDDGRPGTRRFRRTRRAPPQQRLYRSRPRAARGVRARAGRGGTAGRGGGRADAAAMRAARARAGRRDRRTRPPPGAADGSREFRYRCLDPPLGAGPGPGETRPQAAWATAAPMAAGRRLLPMPVSGPRRARAPARGISRYPRGAVRRGRDHGRGAWQRRRVRHPAPVAERLGLDRTGLASGDGGQRRARAPDRAARGWRVPAAAGAATADPRSRADSAAESASASGSTGRSTWRSDRAGHVRSPN